MQNGYIIQHLTSVEIQEFVKVGGKTVQVYEGAIQRENFEVSPFKNVMDKLFDLLHK